MQALSPLEMVEFLQALRRMGTGSSPSPSSPAYGKFAHLPNSSDEFNRRKSEEIDLEERRSRLVTWVLDASAMIAVLRGEPGGEFV